jgi:hypothetical protein
MLCPACLVVLSLAATNQLANSVALVTSTRLVNFQASAAIFLSADLQRIFKMNYTNQQSISLDIYAEPSVKV